VALPFHVGPAGESLNPALKSDDAPLVSPTSKLGGFNAIDSKQPPEMRLSTSIALAALVLTAASREQAPLDPAECTHPNYRVHLFSKSPLVIYLEGFITKEERSHMLEVAYVRSPHHRWLLPGEEPGPH
jgi:hypothetical protein